MLYQTAQVFLLFVPLKSSMTQAIYLILFLKQVICQTNSMPSNQVSLSIFFSLTKSQTGLLLVFLSSLQSIYLRLLSTVNYFSPLGFPGSSDSRESACNEGDLGSISVSGRLSGGGHGNPLQHSCLENPMDRRAWWATVHGVAKSWL